MLNLKLLVFACTKIIKLTTNGDAKAKKTKPWPLP